MSLAIGKIVHIQLVWWPMSKLEFDLDHDADGVYLSMTEDSNLPSIYHNHNTMDIFGLTRRMQKGVLTVSSDGLQGVLADGVPVGAKVILVQNVDGVLVQVAGTESLDGSWLFTNIRNSKTHAIAFKEGYNAGIVANIDMEV